MHLAACTQYKYEYGGISFHFTNCMVASPGLFILDYDDISMIYVSVCNTTFYDLCILKICLLSGKKYCFQISLEGEQLLEMVRICYHYNPKILFGYTKSNRLEHKEQVRRYKKGLIVRRGIDLDWANREGVKQVDYIELPDRIAQQVQTCIERC